jgi:proteasome accessory factor C
MTGERERLPRLLALVPYLQARPGVAVATAAADFAVTEEQLRRDLQLLWMCGLPGHGPGDLIDLSFEGDSVSVIFDAGMSRPLRLTAEEALALVVALRTLMETPGLTDRDAVERALAKVEAAAGGSVDADTVAVALDHVDRLLPVLQQAIDRQRALALRYYTATRDETTDRVVDPMRLFSMDGRSYLEAWCRRAEGMRVFRLDRIEDAVLLDEPARPPAEAQLRDLSEGVFTPAPEHLLAVLRVAPAYHWVADYYPVSDDTVLADGHRQISVRVADPAWVRALVLGSAGQVRVLSPEWLAEDLSVEAAEAVQAYALS